MKTSASLTVTRAGLVGGGLGYAIEGQWGLFWAGVFGAITVNLIGLFFDSQ